MRPTFSAASLILAALAAILTSTGCATKGLFVPHIVSERVTIRDVEARSIPAVAAASSGQPLSQPAAPKSASVPVRPKRTEPPTAGTTGFGSYADALVAAFTSGGERSDSTPPATGAPLGSSPFAKARPVPIALVAWLVALALVGVVCGAMFYVNRGRWQRTTSKRESEQQSDVGLDDFATELQLPSARR